MLVQGAMGGMATALIQLGKAAGVEVWVTSRSKEGREMAERLGADRTFGAGETLPKKVDAVMSKPQMICFRSIEATDCACFQA
jgi:NADPH:quinone reductase-like Zn-dependent oxidoreductase